MRWTSRAERGCLSVCVRACVRPCVYVCVCVPRQRQALEGKGVQLERGGGVLSTGQVACGASDNRVVCSGVRCRRQWRAVPEVVKCCVQGSGVPSPLVILCEMQQPCLLLHFARWMRPACPTSLAALHHPSSACATPRRSPCSERKVALALFSPIPHPSEPHGSAPTSPHPPPSPPVSPQLLPTYPCARACGYMGATWTARRRSTDWCSLRVTPSSTASMRRSTRSRSWRSSSPPPSSSL